MGNLFNPRALVAQVKYADQHYFEADAVDNPTQNLYYEIIDVSGGVELRMAAAHYDDDEESGGVLQFRLTIDTIVYESIAVAGAWGAPKFMGAISHETDNVDIYEQLRLFDPATQETAHFGYSNFGIGDPPGGALAGSYIRGHDIKVEVRITNAKGTNDRLAWGASYALSEAV